MAGDKRKRSANFCTDEKMRFLRILQRKGNVIISKVNVLDSQTNRLKNKAWEAVASELNLNASGNCIRSTSTLKRLWEKLKQEHKLLKLGGNSQSDGNKGTPAKKIEDPVLRLVNEIIGQGSFTIESVNDCDSETSYTNTSHTRTSDPIHVPNSDVVDFNLDSLDSSRSSTPALNICKEEPIEVTFTQNTKRCRSRTDFNDNEWSNNKSTKSSLNSDFASERLSYEKEKREILKLQKQHMVEEHNVRIKQAEIKNKILETFLKKIQDERPVVPELLKTIANL